MMQLRNTKLSKRMLLRLQEPLRGKGCSRAAIRAPVPASACAAADLRR
jgi:hypothetical protein